MITIEVLKVSHFLTRIALNGFLRNNIQRNMIDGAHDLID